MKDIQIVPSDRYGYDFIPPEYLPQGKDEYWLRNEQSPPRPWRRLKSHEIEILVKNENYCSSWDNFLVSDPFDPALIRNSNFYGLIRLGILRDVLLRHHDFRIPAGIRGSTIISCDIGDDAAIQDCSYISHYIIGSRVILSRIDEMQTTNHAKFGNGVLRDGEDEDVRVWIDVMNEAGGRSILPFRDMLPADACLWACYRDDTALTAALARITQETWGGSRGWYGTIGSGAVIKSSLIIKDTVVGPAAYIKGANKLKNLTIHSSEDEPTQIGEGVEMVNGVVGYGCHVFYGSKAVRFVTGRNCNLKYGARLIHSVLGDNSTVSCCEILNNLIFPVHEQHHNNSFLIASLIQGMSNMAAGATIGSNHNSRANDGEIRAGRGFWPGLSVTLKHSSRFASFVLIAKGDYPYELNISLPFSLVNNNVREDRLEVMPAYFWMYNLYALERNSWKAADRDKRKVRSQYIETDYLSPDTAEEIIAALSLMETWMAAAGAAANAPPAKTGPAGGPAAAPPAGGSAAPPAGGSAAPAKADDPRTDAPGAEEEDPEYAYTAGGEDELSAPGLERHNRGSVILKSRRAATAYREMLRYYAAKTLIEYLEARPALTFRDLAAEMERPDGEWDAARSPNSLTDGNAAGKADDKVDGKAVGRVEGWLNLGGQIVPAFRVDALRRDIREGRLSTWEAIHRRYDDISARYPLDKARHAWSVLGFLSAAEAPEESPLRHSGRFKEELRRTLETRRWIAGEVYRSRAKDFHDPFRAITYRNQEEMDQVVGKAEDNFFVQFVRQGLAQFEASLGQLIQRLG